MNRIEAANDLMRELEDFMTEPLPEASPVSTPRPKPRRGRPRLTPLHERPIRLMSPRELARNGLIETAQNWESIVSRKHAECITEAEAVAQRGVTVTRPSADRAARVRAIAEMLTDSRSNALNRLSNSNIATRIGATFPDVNRDTLRKDIAKAKKLARLT